MKKQLIVVLLATVSAAAFAEQDIMEASLLDLANVKSTIATKRELTVRESPGIVTVITREQIANSGVRDLKEALLLFAPGISFATDVEGATGIAVRGLFGHEGKVLLMMDGVPLNEEVYSTTQYGNHYPAELIEKVEVLRGPGSIIHGNYALIGAINITSRRPENGVAVAARYSQMKDSFSHRNITAAVAGGESLKYSALVTVGEGNRSEGTYTDANGLGISLKDEDAQNPKLLNVGLEKGGWSFRTIFDRYETKHSHLDPTIFAGDEKYNETFETRNFVLQYKGKLSESVEINPYVQYRETYPYRVIRPGEFQFTKFSRRQLGGVNVDWKISEDKRLFSGAEFSTLTIDADVDDANEDPFALYPNGLNNQFTVVFSEFSWITESADLILGARVEAPLKFDAAFVPRLGVHKAFEKWHYKAMASQSYRVPAGIHQDLAVDPSEKLKPEIATNLEVEAGYIFAKGLVGSVNVFKIKVDDPIAYDTPPANPAGAYYNIDSFGTQGAEAEVRYTENKCDIAMNAAYYTAADDNGSAYIVPGHDGSYVGMPNYRINLVTGYKLNRNLGIYPSFTYEGERYGFVGDGAGGTVLTKADEVLLVNLNLRYMNLFTQGLEVSAGLMNMTDEERFSFQGYNGDFPPLPGLGRAVNVMVGYSANF